MPGWVILKVIFVHTFQNAQGCDPMCKVCENEQCFECEPYYYKQVIPKPERESPVPYNPESYSDTPTTTSTTSTTTTTPAPTTETTTTVLDITTDIPTYVKCVSQCDPGETKIMLTTVLHLIEYIYHIKIVLIPLKIFPAQKLFV